MAWDKAKPSDDGLLINFPGEARANWEALETLTATALQITNAKVAAGAGIVDSKLAAITTAGKVSGAALTSLANIPSGAGTIPSANLGSVAQKGANSDITSLSSLSTPLTIAQGGTGRTTAELVTGDWILSSVTTARTGWTNVSATYSDKFIRINGTPLTTGGSNTHTHEAGSYVGPSHTHQWYKNNVENVEDQSYNSGGSEVSLSAGTSKTGGRFSIIPSTGSAALTNFYVKTDGTASITGASASSSNVPAYVQIVIFQKD